MKNNERQIFYYDLEISASGTESIPGKQITVRTAIDLLSAVPEKEREIYLNKNNQHLYISHIEKNENTAVILVNKSDRTVADPVFSDIQSRKRRLIQKREHEGQDHSVHILIKLPPTTQNEHLSPALVLLEHCIGLPISNIKKILDSVLSKAKNYNHEIFTQPHPDCSLDDNNRPKKMDIRFNFRFLGHPSESLMEDLESGHIKTAELISNRQIHSDFDQEPFVKEEKQILAIKINNKIQNKIQALLGLIRKYKCDYEKARIKFTTESGLERTVNMTTNEELDDQNQMYVRREILKDIGVTLQSSYDKPCDAIVIGMKALLERAK